MARTGQHGFAKRQREQKKAEKAAQKRAKREQRANPDAIETSPDASAELDVTAMDTSMAPEAMDVSESVAESGSDSSD